MLSFIVHHGLETLNIVILAYCITLNSLYIILTCLSGLEIRKYLKKRKLSDYDALLTDFMAPPISILVPVFNEEANVVATLRNILHVQYPRFEVILINDGSTDQTLERLKQAFYLLPNSQFEKGDLKTKPIRSSYYSLEYPNLRVIDKENGGKSDALNAGIATSRFDYFLSIDGDVFLETDSLIRIARPIIEDPEEVVAVGGIVRIANGCRVQNGIITIPELSNQLLPNFQVVEYLRAFLAGRSGLARFNANLIISGAFGLFRKDIALEIGGYQNNTMGEDMELVMAFHHHQVQKKVPYKIVYIGDPVCWTEAPESLRVLSRQRRRWHKGLMQALSRYRFMFMNRRYGCLGMIGVPFFTIFEGWGCLVEFAGYVLATIFLVTGSVNMPFAIAFFSLSILLGIINSLASLILEEMSFRRYQRFSDLVKLVIVAVLENVGYRQLVLFYRCQGMWDFIRNTGSWGKMEKRGIEGTTPRTDSDSKLAA